MQSTLLEMYKDIKTVLERNNIRFYSHFGTSIGAIRHNGFIPWDDDMDLLIWEEDLDRVRNILTTELDQDRYYYMTHGIVDVLVHDHQPALNRDGPSHQNRYDCAKQKKFHKHLPFLNISKRRMRTSASASIGMKTY